MTAQELYQVLIDYLDNEMDVLQKDSNEIAEAAKRPGISMSGAQMILSNIGARWGTYYSVKERLEDLGADLFTDWR